ncbi:hypothetical protein BJS_02798 [Bradyrhizobium japonicum SEMIA 5079]|nr:hypothetical protein BJS_02798 [Bradyrhizobium japonicum SEMIA 5079]
MGGRREQAAQRHGSEQRPYEPRHPILQSFKRPFPHLAHLVASCRDGNGRTAAAYRGVSSNQSASRFDQAMTS